MSSNEFDDLFGSKKKTPTEPTPPVRETDPSVPYVPRKRKITAKVDVEKLTKEIVSQVTENLSETIGKQLKDITPPSSLSPTFDQKESYNNLVNDLGMTIGTLQAELKTLEPLKDKIWNEVNRLKWMNSMTHKDKSGFKRHEMFTFFGSTIVSYSDVNFIIAEYKKLKLIHVGRNGWMKLTQKGKGHYRDLLEAKE